MIWFKWTLITVGCVLAALCVLPWLDKLVR